MSARPFSPVWLTLPGAARRRVDSAFEAYECLTTTWPLMAGKEYSHALQACRDALDGFVSPASARKAFISAASVIGADVQTARPEEIAMTNRRRILPLPGERHVV